MCHPSQTPVLQVSCTIAEAKKNKFFAVKNNAHMLKNNSVKNAKYY